MPRFCPNCGTEVDDTAVFCPTCGQPIDQDVDAEMPAAPAWPDPEPSAVAAPRPAAAPPPETAPLPETAPPPDAVEPPLREGYVPGSAVPEEPTRVESRPEPVRGVDPAPPMEPAPPAQPSRPGVDLPITMPVTLSAWLIGIGAALGAVGALVGLFDGFGSAIDLLALVALLGVAATVFLAATMPAIPHLRFVTMAVVLVAFGVGLDRLGVGRAGAGDLLLFLGSAAAVIGAVLLELGQDQPMGGPGA